MFGALHMEERMSKIVNTLLAAAIAAATSLATGTAAHAQNILTVVVPDWTGGQISCQILANGIESELGYKVKRLEIPSGAATLEAMAADDAHVGCELWPSYYPVKDKFFAEYGGDGSLTLYGEHGVVGASSYYVPRYLIEGDDAPAPDLVHFRDLTNHVDLFKSVDSGDKGRLIGCPNANWECEDQARADAYGVPFQAVELGSEAAHWAEMQGAFARGEAFVAYAWEPHWIHADLDLVRLELDDYGDGSCWPGCGWPVDVTMNYGRTDLAEKHPEVSSFVQNSFLSNEEQNVMVLAVDIDGRDLEEVVNEWMEANADRVMAWAQ